jgi:hypothetical protein
MFSKFATHVRQNLVAYLALFVALGGTSYAAATIGSAEVVNNSLRSVDLQNGDGVRSGDVRDDVLAGGGLAAPDLRPNSVGGSEVEDGSLGPADSSNVVARARGNTSVASGPHPGVEYPLTDNTWTQAGNEINLVYGEVTYTPPSACDDNSGGFGGGGDLYVLVDGERVYSAYLSPSVQSQRTISFGFGSIGLFEPGSPDDRTLTARVSDFCDPPEQTFTVDSVKADVVGFR